MTVLKCKKICEEHMLDKTIVSRKYRESLNSNKKKAIQEKNTQDTRKVMFVRESTMRENGQRTSAREIHSRSL